MNAGTGRALWSSFIGMCHRVGAGPPGRCGRVARSLLGPLSLLTGWCEGEGDQLRAAATASGRGGVCRGPPSAMLNDGRFGGTLLERLFGRIWCAPSREPRTVDDASPVNPPRARICSVPPCNASGDVGTSRGEKKLLCPIVRTGTCGGWRESPFELESFKCRLIDLIPVTSARGSVAHGCGMACECACDAF